MHLTRACPMDFREEPGALYCVMSPFPEGGLGQDNSHTDEAAEGSVALPESPFCGCAAGAIPDVCQV